MGNNKPKEKYHRNNEVQNNKVKETEHKETENKKVITLVYDKEEESPQKTETTDTDKKSEEKKMSAKSKKIKWWDKLVCRMAKKHLKEKDMQIENLEKTNNDLSSTIDTLEEQIAKLQVEITSQKDKFEELNASLPSREEKAKQVGKKEAEGNLLEALKQRFVVARDTMNYEEALRLICNQIEKLNDNLKTANRDVESAIRDASNDADYARKRYEKEAAELKKKLEQENENIKKRLENDAQEKINEANAQKKNAEEQIKEAAQKTAEAQQRSDDADKRVAEIEATDKGELVVKLEQAEASLNENNALLAERYRLIKQLQTEKAKAKERIESLESDLVKEKDSHNATKKEWRDNVDGMKASHRSELKTKDEEYADNIKNIKEGHQTEINNIKASHNEVLREKDDIHRSEIEKEQAKAKAKENELNDVIGTQKDVIRGLENKLQTEANMLRTEAELTSQRLFEFLKENEIMAACDDGYKDNVEEKLQDIVYEAKQMCQAIKDMPQAKTPSEWINTLTEYFESQIDKNTSLINRVLKFYAMSNVPFMLDSERDNGIYFVRKNMNQAYDYIASLLAQCGIIPIIPSAFVENKDEGLYEVEGQFNDIESFCPGNMSQHVEYVERSSDGLSGIIVGITRVGYIIKNEKVIKAQVIAQ